MLLVNNYESDVLVKTTLPSPYDSIRLKSDETIVVSEQPRTKDPLTVSAVDADRKDVVNINDQSSVQVIPSDYFGSLEVLYIFREIPVPTPAPGTILYYVVFIITNTYGEEIILRTTMYRPYDSIGVLNGQTIRFTIPVPTNEVVEFRAVEKDSGKRIFINEKIVFQITPQDAPGAAIVLTVPDYIVKGLVTDVTSTQSTSPSTEQISTTTASTIAIVTDGLSTKLPATEEGTTEYSTTRVLTLSTVPPPVETTIGSSPEAVSVSSELPSTEKPSTEPPPVETTAASPTEAVVVSSVLPSTEEPSTEPPPVETTAATATGPTSLSANYFIVLRVLNKYPGAIGLKSDLPPPSSYFKIAPGEQFDKTFQLTSGNRVGFVAFDALSKKKLLVNGQPILFVIPATNRNIITAIDVTEYEEPTVATPSATLTTTGCTKSTGEQIRVGEEYSEDNCSRVCLCTLKGIECRTLCPVTTVDLLGCKSPYTLKFSVVPADPPSLGCFCSRVDCLLPEGLQTTPSKATPVSVTTTKTVLETGEAPVIRKNKKVTDVVPKHKTKYKSVVGASIVSRANVALTIVCRASGVPKPVITWTVNGAPVKPTIIVKILSGGRLRIKALSSSHIGIYQCKATNAYGVDTATSKVTVYDALPTGPPTVSARYYIPIKVINKLNKAVIIRTSLPAPSDSIPADANVAYLNTLLSATPNAVIVYAEERESRKRVLVNNKPSSNLIPQRTPGRVYELVISEDRDLWYYIAIRATNNYGKSVELKIADDDPKNAFEIFSGAVFTVTVRTKSKDPVTVRVLDKETRAPVFIDGKTSVSITPSESQSDRVDLTIEGAESKLINVNFTVTNNYGRTITLRTSLKSPNNKIAVLPGQTVRVTEKVPASRAVTVQALDAGTGSRLTVNGKSTFVFAAQKTRGSPFALYVPREAKPKYHLFLNVKNNFPREVILQSSLKAYESVKLKLNEEFGLRMETIDDSPVTFRATQSDGSPVLINGQQTIVLTPSVDSKTTFTLNIRGISVPTTSPVVYHIRFKVINNHNRDILVNTTLESPYASFLIRPKDSFSLTVRHYSSDPVIIRAVDKLTGRPITLNGLKTVFITPQLTPGPELVYGAPDRFQVQFVYLVLFELKNTANTTLRLETKIPPYEKILVKPGETLRLNVSVPSPSPVFVFVYDNATSLPFPVSGKTVFVIFPEEFRVRVTPKPIVTSQKYQLRFSIENKFDKDVFIKTTLPKPYDIITIRRRRTINFALNTTSNKIIVLEAYDFQSSEKLTINDQFKVQLTPQTGSPNVVSLVVPSKDYKIYYVVVKLINNYGKEVIVQSGLDPPHDSITVAPGEQTSKMTIPVASSSVIVFSVIDAKTGQRLDINRKRTKLVQPSLSKDDPEELYIPSKDIFYVTFNMKNKLEKDIILKTSMPEPHDSIRVPKGQEIKRTIVLVRGDPITIRAVDAITDKLVTIDGKKSINVVPSRQPVAPVKYNVPSDGPYFLSFYIKNLYSKAVIPRTSLNMKDPLPGQIEPGKALERFLEVPKADAVTFRVYDAEKLELVTINGQDEVTLVPTEDRMKPSMLYVPYIGCPIVGKEPFRVGQQYATDECTRVCTCTEQGVFACLPLCPVTPVSSCAPNLVQQKTRVPAGPPGSRCTCEQFVCVEPQPPAVNISERVIPPGSINYALLGATSQSSSAFGGYAFQAVDGDRNGNFLGFSCSHTKEEDNPWWTVSLGSTPVNVSAVRITNRVDCCSDRLTNFTIHIGEYFGEEGYKNPQCGGLHTITGRSRVIACPKPLAGKYFTIRIPGKDKILTLCEVEVFGTLVRKGSTSNFGPAGLS